MKVKEVTKALKQMKLNVGEMHSDLEQAQREEVMYEFKAGRINILVATDIVARGIDIDDIRLVINFDVPHDSEDYVHRIGRTARANNDGVALTFVNEKEQTNFKSIENFLKKQSIRYLCRKSWVKLPNTSRAPMTDANAAALKAADAGTTEPAKVVTRIIADEEKAGQLLRNKETRIVNKAEFIPLFLCSSDYQIRLLYLPNCIRNFPVRIELPDIGSLYCSLP